MSNLNSQEINKLTVIGNERISSDSIKVFADFNYGDDINDNDLNNILKNLYETNFFKNVSLKIKNDELIVTVQENYIIQEVIINGVKKKSLKEEI